MNEVGSNDETYIRFPEYEHIPHERVFYNRNGRIQGKIADGFYAVALHTVKRILQDSQLEDDEGAATLYLFRHYLELTLKNIVHSLRRLKTEAQNCPEEDRSLVKQVHPLKCFWEEIIRDCPQKVGSEWHRWDIKEVEICVLEFNEIDPRGERFRYHIENGFGILLCEKDGEIEFRCPNAHKLRGKRTQAELADELFRCAQCDEEEERKAKEKGHNCDQNAGTFRVRDRLNPLAVSWPALFKNMQHTHCVLEAMHKYLVETYFQNDEWEGEQNSW